MLQVHLAKHMTLLAGTMIAIGIWVRMSIALKSSFRSQEGDVRLDGGKFVGC